MEKNLKIKRFLKKNREKMCKEKETILKGARGEELIELIIRRNSLGNWVILNFSGQKPQPCTRVF